MRILLVNNTKIPVHFYGGTERIIWWLGKALSDMGHEVTFLVKKGSSCPFARVLTLREKIPLAAQIPDDVDLAHLHFESSETLPKPTLTTVHGNSSQPKVFDKNTVFISHNHAQRHGGSVFVYNGLDWDDYGEPLMDNRRSYFHFLGNAAWRVKNVRGAIELTGKAGERLHVLGGTRVNFRMGLRVTLSPNVRFHGMVGGDGKNVLLNGSKGLVFPVLWHEPFGLAIIESLFFGCPVFGTPYGALPELLGGRIYETAHSGGQVEALYSEFGRLSIKKSELVEAIKHADDFDHNRCRQYVTDNFSAARMAADYLTLYEKVLNGQDLHAQAPELKTAPEGKLLSMEA